MIGKPQDGRHFSMENTDLGKIVTGVLDNVSSILVIRICQEQFARGCDMRE